MRLELFPLRYRDPLIGKWVRARYVAERYAEYEIIGPPEIRDVDPAERYFNPASGECRMEYSYPSEPRSRLAR